MIKFGPSGTSEDFTLAGHTHTEEMPQWLAEHELDCFEYSFGRGVRIRHDTAKAIGAEFAKLNKEISVHAPYFINLATKEEEKAENNQSRRNKIYGKVYFCNRRSDLRSGKGHYGSFPGTAPSGEESEGGGSEA